MRTAALLFTLAVAGCGTPPPVETAATAATAESPVDVMQREVAAGDAVLVDVRSDVEWSDGHAAAATHLPVTDLSGETASAAGLPKDRRVYTYCKAGVRAARAADILKAAGYDAVPLAGGFDDLKAAGVPTE